MNTGLWTELEELHPNNRAPPVLAEPVAGHVPEPDLDTEVTVPADDASIDLARYPTRDSMSMGAEPLRQE
jgi:hypothetical protein